MPRKPVYSIDEICELEPDVIYISARLNVTFAWLADKEPLNKLYATIAFTKEHAKLGYGIVVPAELCFEFTRERWERFMEFKKTNDKIRIELDNAWKEFLRFMNSGKDE